MSFTVERTPDEALMIRHDAVMEGWEQWYLLRSDAHYDNPLCDRKLFMQHMNQARERNAGIIDIGDLFCLMGGKYDPRSDKRGVRPEYQVGDYIGAVEDDMIATHEPYADLFVVAADGNHNTSIQKRLEYDIQGRFCRALNINRGKYSGWLMFRFGGTKGNRTTRSLFYHHGMSGGAVTKGALNPTRVAAYTPDADIVAYGHIHEQWLFPVERQRISDSGRTYFDTQYHVQCPTYKQEYVHGGYHTEKARPPKPLGAWWMKFYFNPRKAGNVGVHFEMADN
jgi:hypothetical protein